MPYATEPGFYDGKFVKRGGHYAGDTGDNPADSDQADTGEPGSDSNDGQAAHTGQTDQSGVLDSMTKDELLAEAEQRGVEVKSGATKAEIVAALNG